MSDETTPEATVASIRDGQAFAAIELLVLDEARAGSFYIRHPATGGHGRGSVEAFIGQTAPVNSYMRLNPVRAELVAKASEYRWSSEGWGDRAVVRGPEARA